jgi:hypothetical protein
MPAPTAAPGGTPLLLAGAPEAWAGRRFHCSVASLHVARPACIAVHCMIACNDATLQRCNARPTPTPPPASLLARPPNALDCTPRHTHPRQRAPGCVALHPPTHTHTALARAPMGCVALQDNLGQPPTTWDSAPCVALHPATHTPTPARSFGFVALHPATQTLGVSRGAMQRIWVALHPPTHRHAARCQLRPAGGTAPGCGGHARRGPANLGQPRPRGWDGSVPPHATPARRGADGPKDQHGLT